MIGKGKTLKKLSLKLVKDPSYMNNTFINLILEQIFVVWF